MRKPFLLALLLPTAVILLHACSGAEDPSFQAQKSACETANQELCRRACECAAGVGCNINDPPPGATVSFGSVDDCKNLLIPQLCQAGTNSGIDYEACEVEVKTATCIVDPQGKKAVARPRECTVPVDKPDASKDGTSDATKG